MSSGNPSDSASITRISAVTPSNVRSFCGFQKLLRIFYEISYLLQAITPSSFTFNKKDLSLKGPPSRITFDNL